MAPESPVVVRAAAAAGERRLRRLTAGHVVTALIGGMAVSFGALAMAATAGPWLSQLGQDRAHWLGSLFFPVGFVILLVGAGELFTENFLLPVTGVFERRGQVSELLELWGATLLFNLVGGAIFAGIASRPGVLSDDAARFMQAVAAEKVDAAFSVAAVKGVFAGWLMTLLTWLLLSAKGLGARLFLIWIMGFLIVAGHFNHVVISTVEVFIAAGLGAQGVLIGWMTQNFFAGMIGNVVGGIVFVTLAGYLHAHVVGREAQARQQRVEPAQA